MAAIKLQPAENNALPHLAAMAEKRKLVISLAASSKETTSCQLLLSSAFSSFFSFYSFADLRRFKAYLCCLTQHLAACYQLSKAWRTRIGGGRPVKRWRRKHRGCGLQHRSPADVAWRKRKHQLASHSKRYHRLTKMHASGGMACWHSRVFAAKKEREEDGWRQRRHENWMGSA